MPLTSIIDSAIPKQNFELIRDQVGGILLCEFLNQAASYSLPAECTPSTVDIERFITIDEIEFPIIIVSLDKGKYEETDGDYSGNAVGGYDYDIDFFTGSASTLEDGGDQLATLALHRMMGVARAVLMDNRYATLGFAPDFGIRGRYVSDLYSNPPKKTDNAIDYIHGRLKLHVDAPEGTAEPGTVTATLGGTTVTLFNSDKGFFWGVPATP